MALTCIDHEKLYAKDANVKREDVRIIQEWLKKQPHLPMLEEMQIIMALHSCYYRIEAAKITIDNYFTIRDVCPELFESLDRDGIKRVSSALFANVLTKKTPEGYGILMLRLFDDKPEVFNCATFLNYIVMVATLHLHQNGFLNGAMAIFDMKGFGLGHAARLNLNVIKHALSFVQDALPVRIKGVHVINALPLADKVLAMLKPFIKSDLYNMIQFHPPGSETLYKHVPKECLPEEYGGQLSSMQTLNEKSVNNMLDHLDFYKWHDGQKIDESKRIGKSKFASDFGVDGTFKRLDEID
ncbi:alpha-tocopherol transfer protein [Tribolium castaneum]|uniref:Alpha-tocopherol transfer protein-like Protein n=1 Tax=Tribolium castaneum TaxID=7070 RepID=D6WEZ3_TRICA|nr:PREDICTED: alpha-tocopherol transfer protein-like [Tribolium castaneum]EFA00459.2 Alpha-tocopherol transfer protein-like Protein [Tribolium castaneum]|eukprot:XP_967061.2 PREDICTED: alpha-tocopherol transfer protein-like [Tribolium castaneum]